MSVPVHSLTTAQKIWYARTVVAAILADNEIDASETEFLKRVFSIVEEAEERKRLMASVANRDIPALSAPEGVSADILAAVFIELILILISDADFDAKEKSFLKKVADLFRFSDHYYAAAIDWGREGLSWKNSQKELFDERSENLLVPIGSLNRDQKAWYAKVLIASIICDGNVEKEEIAFVKMATTFLEDQKEKRNLLAYVHNRICPPIESIPDIPQEIVGRIFVESMLIVSADENLSYREQAYLKRLAGVCGISNGRLEHLLQWCRQGIEWKRKKAKLIAKREFKAKRRTQSKARQSQPFNSITEHSVRCFVCGSDEPFAAFRLKPKTQKPDRNVFGIITYRESFEGFDFIDYNYVKIIVCPTCLFASAQVSMFRRSREGQVPALLSEAFRRDWCSQIAERKELFGGWKRETEEPTRSLPTAVKSYHLAISATTALAKEGNDPNQNWVLISLLLNLAEIVSADGDQEKADQLLARADEEAKSLFKIARDYAISFKTARILVLIGLYHDDMRQAGIYLDFFHEVQRTKIEKLGPNDLMLFKKIYGEVKRAVKNRPDYKKRNLFGFHTESR